MAFTGDLGSRTNLYELTDFLVWFEKQPAELKLFIGGNHDHCLDKHFPDEQYAYGNIDSVQRMIMQQNHKNALELIKNYKVKYLCDESYVFGDYKFYGSPYSPSFHRANWCFNADEDEEIQKVWAKIPSDVHILLTHTPVYGVLDDLKECRRPDEDEHAGCADLKAVMHKRLQKLKLHMFGHIHSNYGVTSESVSNTRRVMFSNGAVLDNQYKVIVKTPVVINI